MNCQTINSKKLFGEVAQSGRKKKEFSKSGKKLARIMVKYLVETKSMLTLADE